jgi:ankyrin repeat protein
MNACTAVSCEHCGQSSCWYCEAKIFGDSHEHCREAHGGYSYDEDEDQRFTKIRVHRKVWRIVSEIEDEATAQEALSRCENQLRDLGVPTVFSELAIEPPDPTKLRFQAKGLVKNWLNWPVERLDLSRTDLDDDTLKDALKDVVASTQREALTRLDLRRNPRLHVVPDEVRQLTGLQELLVDSSVHVPESMSRLVPNQLIALATEGDNDSIIEMMQDGGDVNVTDHDGRTPLHWACAEGRLETCRLLVERYSASLGAKDVKGRVPLHLAMQGGNSEICRLLLAKYQARAAPDLNVNLQDAEGRTALMVAVERGHVEIVRLLLDVAAIDINMQDYRGRTALMYAVENRHVEIVRLLVDVAAIDINMQDEYGCSRDVNVHACMWVWES